MTSVPAPAPPRAVVGLAVLVGALVTAATLAAAAAAPRMLPWLSDAVPGLLALAGVPVLLAVRRPPGRLPSVRAAALVVALLAGTGALVLGAGGLLDPTSSHPTVGGVLALAATPFAVLTVLRVPRSGGDAVRLARLLPITVFVGAAAALLVWRTVLVDAGTAPPTRSSRW